MAQSQTLLGCCLRQPKHDLHHHHQLDLDLHSVDRHPTALPHQNGKPAHGERKLNLRSTTAG